MSRPRPLAHRFWRCHLFSVLALVGVLVPGSVAFAEPDSLQTSTSATALPTEVSLDEVLAKKYPTTVEDLRTIERRVIELRDKLIKSTVSVRVGGGEGSGVIINSEGFVLTAGHVSGRSDADVRVTLHDGKHLKGKTLGRNRAIDSGLIKIGDERDWEHVEMAEPGDVKPGDWCIAVGHPGGRRSDRPPVLRLGRILFADENVICTDCTLVGGDSGGPLFNLAGKVIGIHSRIGLQATTNFHVPIATYHATWDRLAAGEMWGGRIGSIPAGEVRPLLGVAGNPSAEGCLLTQVFDGSPAKRAGLKVGDLIEKFNGNSIESFNQLAERVGEKKPGQKIALEIRRGEELLKLEVVLGAMKGNLPGGPEWQDSDEDS